MPDLKSFFRAALVLSALVSAASCAKEGVGERCDVQNNNDDCDTSMNLSCVPDRLVSGAYICCPPANVASTDACNGASARLGTGGADSGAGGATAPDAAADAAKTDAGGDR